MVLNVLQIFWRKLGLRGVTVGQLTILFIPLDDGRRPQTENHEAIHRAQFKECGGILKTLKIYYRDKKLLKQQYPDKRTQARLTRFEQEAYDNADNLDYLKTRESFSWKRYKI